MTLGLLVGVERGSLHFLNLGHNEYFVLMELLVHGQLACLSESFGAALVWTPEWLLSSVNVGMLFEVLTKSKLLEADDTNKLFSRLMRC